MKLIDNAGDVLKKAWSVRLMVLAAILTGAETLMAFDLFTIGIPPAIRAPLTAMVVAGAFIARFYAQANMDKKNENGQ